MINAIDVGNFFVDLCIHSPENDLTNLKLNKLVYFAQVWSLVKHEKPLFTDTIEAWKYGPVVPNVYYSFNHTKGNIITSLSEKTYSPDSFSLEEIRLLLDVFRNYGVFSANRLVQITHETGSPWSKAYEPEKQNPISLKDIKEYYQTAPFKIHSIDVSKVPRVGYVNENGILVLPAEMNCKTDLSY